MPRMSDTMEQGTVARWVKHEGDSVAAGDVIAEIDTDKATMDLTAYEDGVLLKILVGEGESADLGTPIALIGPRARRCPRPPPAGTACLRRRLPRLDPRSRANPRPDNPSPQQPSRASRPTHR